MKRLILSAVLLIPLSLLGAPDGRAQVSRLQGRVVDEQGEPLSGVQVAVKSLRDGQSYELTTDEDGSYGRLGLGGGEYVFTFTKEGYRSFTLRQHVELGMTTIDPITLKVAPSGIEGVSALEFKEFQKEFARGTELMQAGQLDEAETVFKDIARRAPTIVPAHVNLSYIYRQKEDWAAAESELLQVLEADPQLEAYVALTDVYRQSGQDDKLRQLLFEAAPSFEEDVEFQLEAGYHYFNMQDLEQAAVAFEKAQSLDPARAQTYYYLGALALGQADNPAAIAHLEKYLSLAAPDDANVAPARQMLDALKAAAPAGETQ